MTTTPLVSVIMPVRNGARFVEEAVRSVLAQTWEPLELLVVDGASTDRSCDIIRGIGDTRVRIEEQVGSGVAAAWNQGLEHTTGPLVAFLSADDRWTPGKLAIQVAILLANARVQYTVAHFRYFLEPGCDVASFNRTLLDRDLPGRIMETLVARRPVFDVVGRFNTSFHTAEDVDWYARAQDLGVPMHTADEVLLHKRVHDRNLSASGTLNTPHLARALHASIRRRMGRPDARPDA